MFVQNFVDVADTQYSCSISHENSSVYSGPIATIPYYLLNEMVLRISFLLNNWILEI